MTADAASPPPRAFGQVLRFGRFSLDPARKLLLEDGRAVRLGGRALDLLVALVERAGEVVSHEALFALVWPHTVVEESSLRVHMSTLRKALGDGGAGLRYIANHPGQGYSFVMPIDAPLDAAATPSPDARTRRLPSRLTSVVGRADVLALLADKLERHALLTIVGPGGIGKTTVALALADRLASRHADGALLVDLAPLSDPALVPVTLAEALGIAAPAHSPWPTLDAFLRERELLIVLDNCEHLIAAAASLAEHVLHAAPRVRILATSREPLDAESEALHRLAALEAPGAGLELDLRDALDFPALRLFVERATASSDDFVLSQASLGPVSRLCRHLDGMPLAIELAAARVGSLGIHALVERLDDVFGLMNRRRTSLARHQTPLALLDWSHDLLDPDEQVVLRRLSSFRASFTLDGAADVASGDDIAPSRAVACVLNLVSKSLVELEPGATPRYRLLFVTRRHAGDKLAASGEVDAMARRHAAYVRDLLARANADVISDHLRLPQWLATYAPVLCDLRAALAWANGDGGDPLLGAEMVVEADRLVMELGLNDEFVTHTELALAAVRAQPGASLQLEFRLLSMLCVLAAQTHVEVSIPESIPIQLEALSERIEAPAQRRLALQALCAHAFGRGDYPAVLAHLAQFQARSPAQAPSDDLGMALIAGRFGALGHHYLGDHASAQASGTRLFELVDAYGSHYPHLPARVTLNIVQARILWLQGAADRALAHALEVLALSEGTHPFGTSHALALAVVPILLWRGDDAAAVGFVDRLARHATSHFQSYWVAWSASYCQVLALRGQDVDAIRRRIGGARGRVPGVMEADMLGTLVGELVEAGQLARAEAGTVGWCAPEILRARAEALVSAPSQRARAEALLLRSLALAHEQGARAWTLRTATTLGTLWSATGRREEAVALVRAALAGLTEGLDCVDVRRAAALLS